MTEPKSTLVDVMKALNVKPTEMKSLSQEDRLDLRRWLDAENEK